MVIDIWPSAEKMSIKTTSLAWNPEASALPRSRCQTTRWLSVIRLGFVMGVKVFT
jgi:hypothetical protein